MSWLDQNDKKSFSRGVSNNNMDDVEAWKKERNSLNQKINNLESTNNLINKNFDQQKKDLAEINTKFNRSQEEYRQLNMQLTQTNKQQVHLKQQTETFQQQLFNKEKEKETMIQKINKLEMDLKKRGATDSFLPLPVSKKKSDSIKGIDETIGSSQLTNAMSLIAELRSENESLKSSSSTQPQSLLPIPTNSRREDHRPIEDHNELRKKNQHLSTKMCKLENEKISLQKKFEREKEDLSSKLKDLQRETIDSRKSFDELLKQKKTDYEKDLKAKELEKASVAKDNELKLAAIKVLEEKVKNGAFKIEQIETAFKNAQTKNSTLELDLKTANSNLDKVNSESNLKIEVLEKENMLSKSTLEELNVLYENSMARSKKLEGSQNFDVSIVDSLEEEAKKLHSEISSLKDEILQKENALVSKSEALNKLTVDFHALQADKEIMHDDFVEETENREKIVKKLELMQEELNRFKSLLLTSETSREEFAFKSECIEKEVAKLRVELDETRGGRDEDSKDLRQKIDNLEDVKIKNEVENRSLLSNISTLQSDLQSQKDYISQLTSQLQMSKQRTEQLLTQISTKESEINTILDDKDKLISQMNLREDQNSERVSILQANILRNAGLIESLQSDANKNENLRVSLSKKLEAAVLERNNLASDVLKLEASCQAGDQILPLKQQRIHFLEREIEIMKAQINALGDEKAQLTETVDGLNKQKIEIEMKFQAALVDNTNANVEIKKLSLDVDNFSQVLSSRLIDYSARINEVSLVQTQLLEKNTVLEANIGKSISKIKELEVSLEISQSSLYQSERSLKAALSESVTLKLNVSTFETECNQLKADLSLRTDDMDDAIAALEGQTAGFKAKDLELERLKADREKLTLLLDDMKKEDSDIVQELENRNMKVEKLQGEVENLKVVVCEISKVRDDAREMVASLEQKLEESDCKLSLINENMAKERSKLESKFEFLTGLNEQMKENHETNFGNLLDELKKSKQELVSARDEKASIEDKLFATSSAHESAKDECSRLSKELILKSDEYSRVKSLLDDLNGNIEKIQGDFVIAQDQTKAEIEQNSLSTIKILELESKLRDLNLKFQTAIQSKEEMENELDSLKSKLEDSTNFVISSNADFTNKLSKAADCIKSLEDTLKVSVETEETLRAEVLSLSSEMEASLTARGLLGQSFAELKLQMDNVISSQTSHSLKLELQVKTLGEEKAILISDVERVEKESALLVNELAANEKSRLTFMDNLESTKSEQNMVLEKLNQTIEELNLSKIDLDAQISRQIDEIKALESKQSETINTFGNFQLEKSMFIRYLQFSSAQVGMVDGVVIAGSDRDDGVEFDTEGVNWECFENAKILVDDVIYLTKDAKESSEEFFNKSNQFEKKIEDLVKQVIELKTAVNEGDEKFRSSLIEISDLKSLILKSTEKEVELSEINQELKCDLDDSLAKHDSLKVKIVELENQIAGLISSHQNLLVEINTAKKEFEDLDMESVRENVNRLEDLVHAKSEQIKNSEIELLESKKRYEEIEKDLGDKLSAILELNSELESVNQGFSLMENCAIDRLQKVDEQSERILQNEKAMVMLKDNIQKSEVDVKHLIQDKDSRIRQTDEKVEVLKQKLEQTLLDLQHKTSVCLDMEADSKNLQISMERLQDEQKSMNEKLENQNSKYETIQSKLETKKTELHQQSVSNLSEILNLKTQIESSKYELDQKCDLISKLEAEVDNSLRKITDLETLIEVERKASQDEISTLHLEVSEVEDLKSLIAARELEMTNIQAMLEKAEDSLSREKSLLFNESEKVKDLEIMAGKSKGEIDELKLAMKVNEECLSALQLRLDSTNEMIKELKEKEKLEMEKYGNLEMEHSVLLTTEIELKSTIKSLETEKSKLEDNLTRISFELDSLQINFTNSKSEFESKLSQSKDSVLQLESKSAELANIIKTQTNLLETLESTLQSEKLNISIKESQITEIQSEILKIEGLEASLNDKQEIILKMSKDLEDSEIKQREKEESLELKTNLVISVESDLKDLKNSMTDLTQSIDALRAEKAVLNAKADEYLCEISSLKVDLDESRQDVGRLNENIVEIRALGGVKVEELSVLVSKKEVEINYLQTNLEVLHKELDGLIVVEEGKRSNLESEVSRLQSLDEEKKSRIEALMKEKKILEDESSNMLVELKSLQTEISLSQSDHSTKLCLADKSILELELKVDGLTVLLDTQTNLVHTLQSNLQSEQLNISTKESKIAHMQSEILKIEGLEASLNDKQEIISKMNTNLENCEIAFGKCEESLELKTNLVISLEGDLTDLKKSITDLTQSIESLLIEKADLNAKADEYLYEISGLKDDLGESRKVVGRLNESIVEIRALGGVKVEELSVLVSKKEVEINDLQTNLEVLQKELDGLIVVEEGKRSNLESEVSRLQSLDEEKKSRIESLMKEKKILEDESSNMLVELKSLQTEISLSQSDHSTKLCLADKSILELELKIDGLTVLLDTQTNLVHTLESNLQSEQLNISTKESKIAHMQSEILKIEVLEGSILEKDGVILKLNKDVELVEVKLRQAEQIVDTKTKLHSRLENDLNDLRYSIKELNSSIDLLKEEKDSLNTKSYDLQGLLSNLKNELASSSDKLTLKTQLLKSSEEQVLNLKKDIETFNIEKKKQEEVLKVDCSTFTEQTIIFEKETQADDQRTPKDLVDSSTSTKPTILIEKKIQADSTTIPDFESSTKVITTTSSPTAAITSPTAPIVSTPKKEASPPKGFRVIEMNGDLSFNLGDDEEKENTSAPVFLLGNNVVTTPVLKRVHESLQEEESPKKQKTDLVLKPDEEINNKENREKVVGGVGGVEIVLEEEKVEGENSVVKEYIFQESIPPTRAKKVTRKGTSMVTRKQKAQKAKQDSVDEAAEPQCTQQ